ncbi:MAG: hypothetical protein A2Z38_07645 [Planctomycetes bacterium RBG_19FT_COMBO_48_8]|nr:MAG: hypothetical protein A2Z38_07645 [Planctomycetes bacterium RBG_19FT_COMBO_48_8]
MQKKELVDFLIRTCKEKDLSFRSLSVKAGLSAGTVHSILYREYEPSLYSLNQLADYLGVKRQYLWKLAGLLEDKDLDDKSYNKDPRINYYCEKLTSLPDPARELVIRIMGDIINYHGNLQESNSPSHLWPIESQE